MTKTRNDIARDLLQEANYYWHDDNEDRTQALNLEDYDPVVDKIFKANAVELEKLYAEIKESQNEIILGLSKTLVPDQFLLPDPGYTVAQVKPKAFRIDTTPEDRYEITGQSDTGEKYEYYFTPLFEHNYPKCELAVILTDNQAIKFENNVPEVVGEISGGKSTQTIWLGLDIERVEEEDVVPFFLGNKIVDEFDKDHHVFQEAKWLLNGEVEKALTVKTGIEGFGNILKNTKKTDLLDVIDIPNSYQKQIYSRLRNSFMLVSLPLNIDDVKRLLPPDFENRALTDKLDGKKALCWIKLELSLAISNDFLVNNILYPNCVPLVNRRMIERHAVKSNYDRIVLPMPTTDTFLDVYKIQDRKGDEDGGYERVDFLHPDSEPGTFMLRSGSRVRRLNREDASQRIYRLLEIIQDEYSTFKEQGANRLREDFDVIEKAVNRIKQQLPDVFREKDAKTSYFCIANFKPDVSRLYYSYWETQGELIKHLGNKTGLELSSDDVNIADSKSIIPIQKGKGELTAEDYINQTKISLLSRGRIMTRGDIELYCKSRYGKLLRVEKIGRELMMLEEGKLGRGILVQVKTIQKLTRQELDLIQRELQNDLNAKSAFFTYIKVKVNEAA